MYAAARDTNLTAASRLGTTVTAAGSANAKGSYTELIASLSGQAEGFYIRVLGVAVNATDTGILGDIATGAAASETDIVSNFLGGGATRDQSAAFEESHGRTYFFPNRVANAARVSARIQAAIASDTCSIAIYTKRGCVHIENATSPVTYGAVTASSRGTSVPSGNGAFGAWTSIGTLSADAKLFLPGFDLLGDTTTVAEDVLVQIGYGASAPGAGGTAIDAYWSYALNGGQEGVAGPFPHDPIYADLPSGAQLWARIAGETTENRGIVIHAWNGTVVTAGGGSTARIIGG